MKHRKTVEMKKSAINRAMKRKEDEMKQIKGMNAMKLAQFKKRMEMIRQNELM